MKIGDRVVLVRDVIYEESNPGFGNHVKGKIGTIIASDGSTQDVIFDNCPCKGHYNGFCDGFPTLGNYLVLCADYANNISVDTCVCSTYDLTWLGHNNDCPEKKRR